MTSTDLGNSWNSITIDNDVYMICITKKRDAFEIYLTNLIELWTENLTNNLILKKCQELNPLLTVEHSECIRIVTDMLNNISKYIVKTSINHIQLHTDVAGVTMKFALNLAKGTFQQFWEVVTKPLFLSSMILSHQNDILLDLVKKKDEEIFEYKAQGAELIRKQIETKAFSEDQFEVNSPLTKSIDYTNAFQQIIKFYNKKKLYKIDMRNDEEMSSKPESRVNDAAQQRNEEVQDSSTSCELEIPQQSEISKEVSNSKNRSSPKNSSNDKQTCSKRNIVQIIHKRPKKPKTGLNGFIS